MTDETTGQLLSRFVSAVRPVVPLVSVWAHGSLAGGDYQPGRSDLDLIAILDRPCTAAEEKWLSEGHESLASVIPLAQQLHCSYCAIAGLDDPAHPHPHLTWAHGEPMHRPVTPVTRRELHDFGLILFGAEPTALLPPVTDKRLAEFIKDLESFWLPSLGHPERRARCMIWTCRPEARKRLVRRGGPLSSRNDPARQFGVDVEGRWQLASEASQKRARSSVFCRRRPSRSTSRAEEHPSWSAGPGTLWRATDQKAGTSDPLGPGLLGCCAISTTRP